MSASIKLPDSLKSWKIISRLPDDNECEIYKVSKKNYDGTVISAVLRYIVVKDEEYNIDNTDFINEEADFLKSISQSVDCFNYLDICVNNNPAKNKIEFFIVTEDLKLLSEVLKTKIYNEEDVIDFGIQMSSILEKLESKNIFHGNINPENIFITADGKYKLGGFSDFESKITDISYIAPEIYNKGNADFTTDLYSLGLILYAMNNDGKLPFENEDTNRENAVNMRLEGKSVTAPKNGSEKLKSIIVIACQPNKDNRWKNAGNIKNALTSIKNDALKDTKNESVIIPEKTDFDGNVFEEYEYENSGETKADADESEGNFDSASKNDAEEITNNSFEEVTVETENNESPENSQNENSETNTETEKDEINSDVFDNFEVSDKAKSFNQQAKEKDYGDYFDETVPVKAEPDREINDNTNSDYDSDDLSQVNIFETDDYENDSAENEKSQKSKKAIVIAVICSVVALAAIGFIAYCVLGGLNSNNYEETTQAQETTILQTTRPTTAPVTTTEPTTVSPEKTVTPVIGYGYYYAKDLLEKEGFKVEVGEYAYSEYWPEGYVISQTPEGDTNAKKGSVVKLDVSLGLVSQETTQAPTEVAVENSYSQKSGDYIFPNSSTAYLSKSDISNLSDKELDYAINEIYARHGRIFTDQGISNYFKSKSWYTPKYTADEFNNNVTFNKYEQSNLELMVNERNAR